MFFLTLPSALTRLGTGTLRTVEALFIYLFFFLCMFTHQSGHPCIFLSLFLFIFFPVSLGFVGGVTALDEPLLAHGYIGLCTLSLKRWMQVQHLDVFIFWKEQNSLIIIHGTMKWHQTSEIISICSEMYFLSILLVACLTLHMLN